MAPDRPDRHEGTLHDDPVADPEGIEIDPDHDDDTRREALELELMDEGASEAGADIGEELD
jgi:hypothetical protein